MDHHKKESAFRGHRQIAALMERIRPLAQWLAINKPGAGERTLTLRRRDYDLLMRWPQAASMHQIWFDPSGTPYFGGFRLRAENSEATHKVRQE